VPFNDVAKRGRVANFCLVKHLLATGAAVLLALTSVSAKEIKSNLDVEELLASMSLDEKVGQMMQLDLSMFAKPNSSPIELDEPKLHEALIRFQAGSFINIGVGHALTVDEWTQVLKTIQDIIMAGTPHKIPLLYGIDSIHGATYVLGSTLFPQSIGMAATRDPDLIRRCAAISARETRAAGLRWTFAPVLDVGRQPLWARFPETYGEDPYLASVLGVAAVDGFQGTNAGSFTNVAACLKHYLGYSFPFSGRDRSPAFMPDWYLREYFLPPFREAVKAGALTVMVNSGEINGTPVHASKYLLTDVLRKELGFKGVVVSDWQDIIHLYTTHHVADSPAEAVRMAIDAGIDMSMVPLDYSFFNLLKQNVQSGRIPQSRIDQSVRRILRLKLQLGLFRNPYFEPETAGNFAQPDYQRAALQAAEESITLLKNREHALPLAKSAKVLVVGPAAKSLSALHGCWSYTWQGTDEKWYPKSTLTIVDAIREKIGAGNVSYVRGSEFDGMVLQAHTAVEEAAHADAIVLCLGEDAYAETPGDLDDFNLPACQLDLARALYETGKPVILVMVEGRGRIIREIEPDARGILMAYWPGSQGARAIANVLFGDTNPSGKLPFTYARYANNLLTYDRKGNDRLNEDSPPGGHDASEYRPQYDFGYGLSYTTFGYTNLTLSGPTMKRKAGPLTVSVQVSNTGTNAGTETVELYTHQLYASLTPPQKRLRAFKKIALAAGETSLVKFDLSVHDVEFVDAESKVVAEPGDFEVLVGNLRRKFTLEK
jgi:beta-glucosidase